MKLLKPSFTALLLIGGTIGTVFAASTESTPAPAKTLFSNADSKATDAFFIAEQARITRHMKAVKATVDTRIKAAQSHAEQAVTRAVDDNALKADTDQLLSNAKARMAALDAELPAEAQRMHKQLSEHTSAFRAAAKTSPAALSDFMKRVQADNKARFQANRSRVKAFGERPLMELEKTLSEAKQHAASISELTKAEISRVDAFIQAEAKRTQAHQKELRDFQSILTGEVTAPPSVDS